MPSTAARVLLFGPQDHLPQQAAEWLIREYGEAAPDYSALTLLAPTAVLAQALGEALVRATGAAILAPQILTLNGLIAGHLAADTASELSCRIRIAEALSRHRGLFPNQPPLVVAEALYALFEELAQAQFSLPDESALLERLQQGYGHAKPLKGLSKEAHIVHSLYQAFCEELGNRAPVPARLQALAQGLESRAERALIFVGFDALHPGEAQLIGAALRRPNSAFLTQGPSEGRGAAATERLLALIGPTPEPTPQSPEQGRAKLLAGAFGTTGTAQERLSDQAGASAAGLRYVAASDAEHEAQVLDLAVRQALLGGAERVAVVTQDRRLARRLRARLERANVSLVDRGGWALSTSRAAAALNAWLECVQQDFPFAPLLNLLKSGSLPGGQSWALQLEPLAFEQGISGGWLHWRRHAKSSEEIERWQHLEEARLQITTLRSTHPAGQHSAGLINSLAGLGLRESFAADAAGSQLLAVLDDLHQALSASRLQLRWGAFRALVDRCLEDASFTLPTRQASVQLLTLAQTPGLAADVVILAGAGPALLANKQNSAFFNNSVRRELGLGTAEQAQALALSRLRCLLLAAPEVLMSCAPASEGEAALLAPPLVALLAFAQASGQAIAHDTELALLAPLAEVAVSSPLPEPIQPPNTPAPSELAEQLGTRGLSASGHQALIACPYRYFARYGLGLLDNDDPDEPPDRSDYGERVHKILQAFHTQLDDLPEPYVGDFGSHQQAAIEAKLQELANAVFAHDVQERAMGSAWRAEFERGLPWLVEQLRLGSQGLVTTEQKVVHQAGGIKLTGTIDRLQELAAQRHVVDYKTGAVPSITATAQGEQVQLGHYALSVQADSASYWDIKARKQTGLEGNEMAKLKTLLFERLELLQHSLADHHLLPAHGATEVCAHCEYQGLCRNAAKLRLPGQGSSA